MPNIKHHEMRCFMFGRCQVSDNLAIHKKAYVRLSFRFTSGYIGAVSELLCRFAAPRLCTGYSVSARDEMLLH